MPTKQKSVLVAMSGGVDSSVTAKLLLDQGYKITGATMKLFNAEDTQTKNTYTEDAHTKGAPAEDTHIKDAHSKGAPAEDTQTELPQSTCCSLNDVLDARDVCANLGVAHYTFNMASSFKQHVMDKFCQEYIAGKTPNPCIDCNRHVKFEALHARRQDLGMDYLATGHYARRAFDEATGRYKLLRAADRSKDQSYVLYCITQDVLAHTLFPLGDLTKKEVRTLAGVSGFPNAEKPDSQDICFIPDGHISSFLQRYAGHIPTPGPIVDTAGNVLGTHTGLENYTQGQRKGIGVAAPERLYVIAKNIAENTLVIGPAQDAKTDTVFANNLNLIHLDSLNDASQVQVKMNYRQEAKPAHVYQLDNALAKQEKINYAEVSSPAQTTCCIDCAQGSAIKVVFDEPHIVPAPGQALVIYDGDVVLGGATITGAA